MPRKNKGDRVPCMVRPQREHHETYKAAAERLGMGVGPYLARVLALAHGLDPDEVPPPTEQLTFEDQGQNRGQEREQAMAS